MNLFYKTMLQLLKRSLGYELEYIKTEPSEGFFIEQTASSTVKHEMLEAYH